MQRKPGIVDVELVELDLGEVDDIVNKGLEEEQGVSLKLHGFPLRRSRARIVVVLYLLQQVDLRGKKGVQRCPQIVSNGSIKNSLEITFE